MEDKERFKLLHGPYHPPQVEIGDWLECERFGPLQVCAWSNGPIPWPRGHTQGMPPYILCGDLVRAVQSESNQAVMYWWGVSKVTVTKWRRALSVPQHNEGTLRLHRDDWPEKMTEEQKNFVRSPEGIAKRLQRRREEYESSPQGNWTAEEDALLGTDHDSVVARQLRRTRNQVKARRMALGIMPFNRKPVQREGDMWQVLSPPKLLTNRLLLGLTQKEVAQRVGITNSKYSHLERGVLWRVKPAIAAALAEAFRCRLEDILDPERMALIEAALVPQERTFSCEQVLPDDERLRLRFAPYHSPQVQIGDELFCEIRNQVRVGGWTSGAIPWPVADLPGKPMILCGDLIRAVRQEASIAIQHWWGIGASVVTQWRKALNVEKFNDGTRQLYGEWLPQKVTGEIFAEVMRKTHRPAARAKAAATLRKSGFSRGARVWTKEEEKLLGAMTDAEVGKKIGLSSFNVGVYRRKLGIAAFSPRGVKSRQKKLVPLRAPAMLKRRLELDVHQIEIASRAKVNLSYYSKLETGQRTLVRLQTFLRLAKALECDPEQLRGEPPKSD